MKHKPLYTYSFEEARRNGDIDLYKQSHNENIACAQAIKKTLAENFDGYHLNPGIEKKIIEDFGFDRTMYVLANTIQHFDYDGRITRDNKDWARTFYIPDNKAGASDRNIEFLIDSPGLVNIFTNSVRNRYVELNLWDKTHCIPADGLDFKNKVVVLKPETLKDEYKTPDYQLFYAQSGFGCSPTESGKQVYGKFLVDGEYTHFERSCFMGQLKPEFLPDWAKEKVKEFQKPSIKEQLAEASKQIKPEQKTKNIDKEAR